MRRKIYEETKASFTVTPEGTLVLTGTQRQRKLALNLIQEILVNINF